MLKSNFVRLWAFLHCALSCGAVYCNRPCLWRTGWRCGSVITITRNCVHRSSPNWVCMTISSWLDFGRPAPPGRGLRRGENLWLATASAHGLRASERFFHSCMRSSLLCNPRPWNDVKLKGVHIDISHKNHPTKKLGFRKQRARHDGNRSTKFGTQSAVHDHETYWTERNFRYKLQNDKCW